MTAPCACPPMLLHAIAAILLLLFFFLFTYTFCCCCTRCLGTLRLLRSVVRTKAFMPIFSNFLLLFPLFLSCIFICYIILLLLGQLVRAPVCVCRCVYCLCCMFIICIISAFCFCAPAGVLSCRFIQMRNPVKSHSAVYFGDDSSGVVGG